MSKEYPFYPGLTEEGERQAKLFLESFKEKMKGIVDEVIGEAYVHCLGYIESDAWMNFRNEIMGGLMNYDNKEKATYDFKRIRRKIFEEYRDEIIKDLSQDLVEENERLKLQIDAWHRHDWPSKKYEIAE